MIRVEEGPVGTDFRILFEKIAEDPDSVELLRLANELQSEDDELQELMRLSAIDEEGRPSLFTTT